MIVLPVRLNLKEGPRITTQSTLTEERAPPSNGRAVYCARSWENWVSASLTCGPWLFSFSQWLASGIITTRVGTELGP